MREIDRERERGRIYIMNHTILNWGQLNRVDNSINRDKKNNLTTYPTYLQNYNFSHTQPLPLDKASIYYNLHKLFLLGFWLFQGDRFISEEKKIGYRTFLSRSILLDTLTNLWLSFIKNTWLETSVKFFKSWSYLNDTM